MEQDIALILLQVFDLTAQVFGEDSNFVGGIIFGFATLCGLIGVSSLILKAAEAIAKLTETTKDDILVAKVAKKFSFVVTVLKAMALHPRLKDDSKT
jgi:uncharacterized membrane protein YuzA (DUF378 family)